MLVKRGDLSSVDETLLGLRQLTQDIQSVMAFKIIMLFSFDVGCKYEYACDREESKAIFFCCNDIVLAKIQILMRPRRGSTPPPIHFLFFIFCPQNRLSHYQATMGKRNKRQRQSNSPHLGSVLGVGDSASWLAKGTYPRICCDLNVPLTSVKKSREDAQSSQLIERKMLLHRLDSTGYTHAALT